MQADHAVEGRWPGGASNPNDGGESQKIVARRAVRRCFFPGTIAWLAVGQAFGATYRSGGLPARNARGELGFEARRPGRTVEVWGAASGTRLGRWPGGNLSGRTRAQRGCGPLAQGAVVRSPRAPLSTNPCAALGALTRNFECMCSFVNGRAHRAPVYVAAGHALGTVAEGGITLALRSCSLSPPAGVRSVPMDFNYTYSQFTG